MKIWYDKESDLLDINLKEKMAIDNSELTDDDVIIDYEKGKIVGLRILHASKRGEERRVAGEKFRGESSRKPRRLKAR